MITLRGLKIRFFAYRSLFKRYVRKYAGFWVIFHVVLLMAGIFLIFHPEAATGMKGHEISPTIEIIAIVVGLAVYFLADRIRG
jgi:hypothetical protein